jgi:hypothetical protein
MARSLQLNGSLFSLDFFGNMGRGMCGYRLPDPFGVTGGPSRTAMPAPWLDRHEKQVKDPKLPDLFKVPGLKELAWPNEMWSALPDARADVTWTSLQSALSAGIEDTSVISPLLRVFLTKRNISLVPNKEFTEMQEYWWNAYDDIECIGKVMSMPNTRWIVAGSLASLSPNGNVL